MTVTGLEPTLERVLDLAGVFVFALSGGLAAVRHRFDVVGIASLAVATGLGGGMVRDVLLGESPPAALRDQIYLVPPLLAAVLVLVAHRMIEVLHRPVLVFDAGGSPVRSRRAAVVGPPSAQNLASIPPSTGMGDARDVGGFLGGQPHVLPSWSFRLVDISTNVWERRLFRRPASDNRLLDEKEGTWHYRPSDENARWQGRAMG